MRPPRAMQNKFFALVVKSTTVTLYTWYMTLKYRVQYPWIRSRKVREQGILVFALQESMDLLAQRIAELLVQSEALGEAGDVDAAQAVVAQADTLKVQQQYEHFYVLMSMQYSPSLLPASLAINKPTDLPEI